MKNSLIFSLVVILTLGSCTDLDITPDDTFTEEIVFQDPAAYRSYLAKVYGAFSLTGQDGPSGDSDISIVNDEGFTSYIRAYWKAQELTTDEAVVGWTDAGIRDLHEHSWSSENQFVRVLYYRISLIVSIANDFIKQSSTERLDLYGIDAADREEIASYRQEARFLRAMAYWHALDLFRNVALVTEITADLPDQVSPKQLFEFIENELIDLENQLPSPRNNEYGRVDQAALWMLQAKIYLNAESMIGENYYAECLAACQKVLDAGYELEANYQSLFLADNHNSNEIIFALNSDGKRTQNWGCTTFLVQAAIGGSMVDTDYGVKGGWEGIRTTKSLVNRFPDVDGLVDQRAIFYTPGQSLDIEDIGEFTNGYAVPKYKNLDKNGNPGSDVTHVDTDYPLFRFGDAMLMYAEAVLRGGGGNRNEALALINALRQRSYGDDSGSITDAELTLDFILEERSRELYWEGTRRVDLIRFNQFTENGIWPWKGNEKEGKLTESFRDIFPIPASDLLSNPKLVQNEGY